MPDDPIQTCLCVCDTTVCHYPKEKNRDGVAVLGASTQLNILRFDIGTNRSVHPNEQPKHPEHSDEKDEWITKASKDKSHKGQCTERKERGTPFRKFKRCSPFSAIDLRGDAPSPNVQVYPPCDDSEEPSHERVTNLRSHLEPLTFS